MKITIIKPSMYGMRSYDAMEPLAPGVLAALTPEDIGCSFYDDRIEAIPYDTQADLAAITVETFTAKRAYQIAAEYRRRKVPVVLGGYHPTLMPEEALEYADTAVFGDGEEVWKLVLDDARHGCMRKTYRQRDRKNPSIGRVDRSIYAGKRYVPLSLVQHGRGCRFYCDFCSIRAYYGPSLFQRPVRETFQEIQQLPQNRLVFFVDDNLFYDPLDFESLLKALIPCKVNWACQISLDITRHPRLLELMNRSGCIAVLIGFESLRDENLQQMGKGWSLRHSYEESVRILQDMGIMVYGTFVFGYDHDTTDLFEETVEFALRTKLFLANFNPLTPMPGTPLYRRLEKENRLIYDKWWLADDFRYGGPIFRPKGMSPEQLAEGCFRARKSFYSHASILRRILRGKSNTAGILRMRTYLAANYLSRREIMQKQGKHLGKLEAPQATT